MTLNQFDALNPFHQVGLSPGAVAGSSTSPKPGLAAVSPLNPHGKDPLWHPDNPLFWFGGLLAVTLGLIAVSTSVKVGPFKGSVSIGETK